MITQTSLLVGQNPAYRRAMDYFPLKEVGGCRIPCGSNNDGVVLY